MGALNVDFVRAICNECDAFLNSASLCVDISVSE